MKRKLYLLIIVLIGLALANAVFILKFPRQGDGLTSVGTEMVNTSQAYILPLSEPSYFPILIDGEEKPVLTAKSAAVYDIRLGRFIFAKNPRTHLPVASLTKILTSLVALEHLNVNDVVTVPPEVIRVDGEKQTLYKDEKISVLSLLKLMLIESSNDSAFALADYFEKKTGLDMVEQMNAKAVSLQMSDSKFLDPAGLNDAAYSTAEDMIKLVRVALREDLLWNITTEKNTVIKSDDGKIEHTVESTNQLFGVIPDVAGGKTGFTNGALGCMILIVDIPGKNDKLITVILGSTERFNDTKKLVDWAKTAYKWE